MWAGVQRQRSLALRGPGARAPGACNAVRSAALWSKLLALQNPPQAAHAIDLATRSVRPVLPDGLEDLVQDGLEVAGDGPTGVMRPQLGEIRDIADMVAHPGALLVIPGDAPACQLLQPVDQFQDRRCVAPATSQVVHLARPRIVIKRLERPDHVFTVDLVADLLALVADDCVRIALDGHTDEVGEETMELNGADGTVR